MFKQYPGLDYPSGFIRHETHTMDSKYSRGKGSLYGFVRFLYHYKRLHEFSINVATREPFHAYLSYQLYGRYEADGSYNGRSVTIPVPIELFWQVLSMVDETDMIAIFNLLMPVISPNEAVKDIDSFELTPPDDLAIRIDKTVKKTAAHKLHVNYKVEQLDFFT